MEDERYFKNMATRELRTGEFYGNVSQKLDCSGFLLTELVHCQERALPEHSHESAYFSILLQGEYSERIGSKELPYGLFSAAFHPPQISHRDHIGKSGAHFFTLEVNARWLDRIREVTPRLNLTPDFCDGEVKWLLSRLYFQYRDSESCSPLAVETISLEILATLAKIKQLEEARRPHWLERVEEYLHAEIRRNVRLEEVAKEAGVHPVYLSRVFRRLHRQSLDAYVTQIRIQEACERLCRGTMPLAEIAAFYGFADQSHFTRAFKKITGSTPAAFRGTLQSSVNLTSQRYLV